MPVSVLSLNCWLIPVKFVFPYLDFYVSERAQRLGSYLVSESPDVLLLQEIWSPSNFIAWLIDLLLFRSIFGRRAIKSSLIARGYKYISTAHGSSFWNPIRFFDSGLMIASKYPVIMEDFLRFDTELYDEDNLASKGVLATAVEISESIVITATSHLSSAGPRALKERQLDIITDFISKFREKVIAHAKKPVASLIFGADLNIDAFDLEAYGLIVEKFKKIGLVDVSFQAEDRSQVPDALVKSGLPTQPLRRFSTSDNFGEKSQKLDYLFASRSVDVAQVSLTRGDLWRTPIDLTIAITKAFQSGDSKEAGRLKKEVDGIRRRMSVTDHAGISAILDFGNVVRSPIE